MIIHYLYDLKLRTYLNKALSKSCSIENRLIKPAYKFIKSISETNSKIQESQIYNELINDPIYRNK